MKSGNREWNWYKEKQEREGVREMKTFTSFGDVIKNDLQEQIDNLEAENAALRELLGEVLPLLGIWLRGPCDAGPNFHYVPTMVEVDKKIRAVLEVKK
jgi:hypothetical protein